MTYRTFIKCFSTLVLVPVCLTLFLAGLAIGETYNLKAGVKIIPARTFNNPKPIVMWGFANCGAAFANCSSVQVQVPGPTLTATAGTALTINVMNSLNGRYQEPVSLVIPGLAKAMTPVWMIPPPKPQGPNWPGAPVATGSRPTASATTQTDPAVNQNDPAYRYRVRSFDVETPADNTTTTTYTWPAANVKEGTYLYQSGTHPAVQVQMGLYGPLVVYPNAGQVFGAPGSAYAAPATPGGNAARPATSYNTEAILLFSEIDPALHDAIATGHYGPNPPLVNPPANWMTSTANYTPRYFLINGNPYSINSPAIPAGDLGQTVLLRFLNAGLATKVPTLQDTFNIIQTPPANLPYMTILAEDGYPLPWLKQQYSLLLPAGKTMDAVIATTPTVGTTTSPGANIAIYDRRGNLTNAPLTPGGQMTYLQVGHGTNGLAGIPAINVFPTSVNFGPVQLYHPMQQIVIIKNNGLQPLLVSNAAPSGPNAAEFQTNTSAALGTVLPGKSASIAVYFTPTEKGPKSATLHITSSDPN
ncbi:MAG TPA: choice-of-anchor D domain-containing protein, partial [Geobacteraceae bacterium]|nr:choice-of-anchor D domain-containing protein [Geobacteraceae bacterium]